MPRSGATIIVMQRLSTCCSRQASSLAAQVPSSTIIGSRRPQSTRVSFMSLLSTSPSTVRPLIRSTSSGCAKARRNSTAPTSQRPPAPPRDSPRISSLAHWSTVSGFPRSNRLGVAADIAGSRPAGSGLGRKPGKFPPSSSAGIGIQLP